MIALLTGLAAGSLHVVSGPDHLAALAPLALEDRARAGWRGAIWGLGHGLGVVAAGGLGLLARAWVDLAVVSAWSERLVGVLLVGLGVWALRRARALTIHAHPHHHEATGHSHLHVHTGAHPHDHPRAHRRHTHAAFGVGVLHGAAGAGHLFGVLPALALETPDAVLYLLGYLVAAVLSMAAFGGALGQLLRWGSPAAVRRLVAVSGLVAIAVGVVWLATTLPAA
ncbi:MAG: hydantoin utilization protein A [Alphaproteobacteria bacterium]|nr:hydantoin utilization protein A [Alphaproteobacteria bacterium]